MATVVVVLSGTCDRSSTPALADVMTASVVSGVISDTDPTKVVLPTPKPPATTILTDVIAVSAAPLGTALELAKSTEHPFKQVDIGAAMRMVDLVNPDQPLHRHIGDQDACHAQRHPEYRRDLRDRAPVPAESQDCLAFRAEHRQITRLVMGRGHHGLDLQLVSRLGPP